MIAVNSRTIIKTRMEFVLPESNAVTAVRSKDLSILLKVLDISSQPVESTQQHGFPFIVSNWLGRNTTPKSAGNDLMRKYGRFRTNAGALFQDDVICDTYLSRQHDVVLQDRTAGD